MVRIPGKVLGVVAALALAAHVVLVVPGFHAAAYGHHELGLLIFLPTLATLIFGRILLAWLPPGEVGGHGWSELPLTLATSLALGSLAHELFERLLPGTTVFAEVVVALLLLVARLLTLPGAMVPRHRVRAQPLGTLDRLGVLAVLAWAGYLLCTTSAFEAHLWLALALLVFTALGQARRARGGRWVALFALAALGFPVALMRTYASWDVHWSAELAPLLALGLGAASLVNWLRRHDRRAGALAGLAFGAVFLNAWDPLALAGPLVLLVFSRPRQRAFVAAWSGASALVCGLVGIFARTLPERGHALSAAELLPARADWGLLLSGALVALALGVLTFPWRAAPVPGAPEEPRREAPALMTLLGSALFLAWLPSSPWSAPAVLSLLATPLVLATGLWLVPPARVD